jgi:hypothetical protein
VSPESFISLLTFIGFIMSNSSSALNNDKQPLDKDNSSTNEKVTSFSLNDNSNPQQGTGTGGNRTPKSADKPLAILAKSSDRVLQPQQQQEQQRGPLKIPPTVKDVRKLFVGGLPSDGTSLSSWVPLFRLG